MFRFACIVLLAAMASAGKVEYQACDSSDTPIGTNIVIDVDEVPHGTSSVTLVKGITYNIQIDFTATSASATLLNKLSAVINGVEIPWKRIYPDACENLITEKCPLKAGTRYTYKNSLLVDEAYPATSLQIIWKLVDAASANEVCFKLPARIVNAS